MHIKTLSATIAGILLAGAVHAVPTSGVTIVGAEVNGDVVLTFSGSINLTNLTYVRDNTYTTNPGFYSNNTFKGVSFMKPDTLSQYSGVSSFSPNTFNPTDLSVMPGVLAGDLFGALASTTGGTGHFYLPQGYTSGSTLSGTVTFAGKSLADLNATTDATFTIGDQTVTYDAQVTPVPVPASLPLMAAGLGALALTARRRR